jgi:predicted RNase H-like HicB family nuclease
MNYIGVIHKDPESDFGVSFPDFPGCITAGRTVAEAKEMALEALSGHMQVMLETGETLPLPSSLDQVLSDPQFSDGTPFVVTIETHHFDPAAAGQRP